MSVEALPNIPWPELTLVAIAISFTLRQKIKHEQRPYVDPNLLEIHHRKPYFMGGNGEEDNLMAVTKVEHALEHYDDAMNTTGDQSRGHWWSVQKIVGRMDEQEVDLFNQAIKGRRRR